MSNQVSPYFLRIGATGFVFWVVIFTAFIAFLDPYGLWNTPKIERINAHKPARANLDRQIKPLEVLRDQPRTIFLGTSRVQQGFDPAVLDGTEYAPAYNASIPAGTIMENEVLLNHYFEIDPSIKHVVMEVFLYQMILGQNSAERRSIWDLTDNLMPLFFSVGALEKSLMTLWVNLRGKRLPFIDARGHWIPPESYGGNSDPYVYSDSIAEIHLKIPDLNIYDSNVQALIRMKEASKKHGAKFSIIFAPNHPWDDYRLLSLGYWPRVESMYKKLSKFGEVYSASQYNYLLTEPTTDLLPNGERMKYWYDPIHFNSIFGGEILRSWAGMEGNRPKDLLIKITPENVEWVLKERMEGLKNWMRDNETFVSIFDQSRQFYCTDEQSCKTLGLPTTMKPAAGNRGRLDGKVLRVDGVDYQLRAGMGGSVESAKAVNQTLILSGWAMDDRKGARPANPAIGIALVVNDVVVNVYLAQYRRSDIEAGFGIDKRPTGFSVKMQTPSPAKNDPVPSVRLFALTEDRYGVPISNSTSVEGLEIIQVPFPAVLI